MRDFLQRQIARTIAVVPGLVRPRLPSLFEPLARDVAAADPLDRVADAQALAPPARPRRGRATLEGTSPGVEIRPVIAEGPAAQQPPPRLSATIREPAIASMIAKAATPLPSDDDDGASTDDRGRAPAVSALARSQARPSLATAPRDHQAMAAFAEARETGRPARAVSAPAFLPQAALDRPPVPLPPAPAGVLQSEARGRKLGGAPQAALSPTPGRAEAPLDRGEPRAASRAASAPPRPFAPPAAAAPTIEVTIGRIEVKASLAPAASLAARRPAPRGPSELETYLRSKGVRRS